MNKPAAITTHCSRGICSSTHDTAAICNAVAILPSALGRTSMSPVKNFNNPHPTKITASRAITITGNQIGKLTGHGYKLNVMIAVTSNPLSAIGSNTTPSALRWLNRRAIQPSKPSLAAAMTNAATAAQRNHSSGAKDRTLAA